jgi:hypothetical protein
MQIFEGTNQIQRMVIARHLAKGGVDLTELRVPATEVARCAGHGVAVLLKIYAHCIDGQADAANKRITDALGTQNAEQDPGDEGDSDSEPTA